MFDEFIHAPRVACFSMEIALRSEIPICSGELGVLAGDTVRSATWDPRHCAHARCADRESRAASKV